MTTQTKGEIRVTYGRSLESALLEPRGFAHIAELVPGHGTLAGVAAARVKGLSDALGAGFPVVRDTQAPSQPR